jgi:CRISPR-associated protein Cmr1
MRRIQSTNLPGFLSRGESPPQSSGGEPGPWRASFELRGITPILGGGVLSFEPDQVDFVRIPAIRGQLRWWWRGLFQKAGDDPNTLFAQEARLWGGVGVPGHGREGDKEPPGLRSRVRITVEILDCGTVKPSGFHEWGDFQLKAVPRWTLGSGLGYALFPLQRGKEARSAHQQRAGASREPMPAASVRVGLRFRLHVSVIGSAPNTAPSPEDVTQVLASLWAWISFGGLGARTRRGFGALELKEPPDLAVLPDSAIWSRLLRGPDQDGILSWLKELEHIASPCGVLWPLEILSDKNAAPTAAHVHEDMVAHLRYFRQGTEFARDPGKRGPGESRWPEADLVRVLAPQGSSFSHEPSAETVELVRAGQVGAPRAAFGLPIQIQFKKGGGDESGNATLLPLDAKRWPSPLLLRPLRCSTGKYLPAAILLPIRLSAEAEVELEHEAEPGKRKKRHVKRSAGAQLDIARLLKATDGDALEAFASWLEKEKRFERISLPPKGAPRA